MAEEKKTTRKTAPKKTTTRRTSKKSEKTALIAEIKPEIVVSLKTATVLPAEGLKIRKGPGVDFDKYAGVKIPAGTEVDVLEEKDGFVRIGYDQWVMKNYLGGI